MNGAPHPPAAFQHLSGWSQIEVTGVTLDNIGIYPGPVVLAAEWILPILSKYVISVQN